MTVECWRKCSQIWVNHWFCQSELTVGALKGALTRGDDGPFWYPATSEKVLGFKPNGVQAKETLAGHRPMSLTWGAVDGFVRKVRSAALVVLQEKKSTKEKWVNLQFPFKLVRTTLESGPIFETGMGGRGAGGGI